jgi:gamma-glutamyl hydrolase
MIAHSVFVIFISFSVTSTLHSTVQALNNRPIIGIVAQSTKGTPVENLGKSYIDAAYVKYLESSGARVVPIKTSLSEDEVVNLFKSINGVLFPGGDVSVTDSDYAKIGKLIYNQAMTAFNNNDYFPLWGICLGFELLATMVSGSSSVLSHSDSDNLPLPLNFTPEYQNSRLFANIAPELAKYLSTAPTTLNLHYNCVSTETLKANKKLNNFFRVLSINKDRNGKQFVSTMEGNKYPFYATQWHPEKNSFEWSTALNIPHYPMSVEVTQYMSNFFVNQTRQSRHKFKSSKEEQAQLIYSHPQVFTGNISNWEQTYIFH